MHINGRSAGYWRCSAMAARNHSKEINMAAHMQVGLQGCASLLFLRSIHSPPKPPLYALSFSLFFSCCCFPPSFSSLSFHVSPLLYIALFLLPEWHHHGAARPCCDVEVETWKMNSWHLPLMIVWLHRGYYGDIACVMCVAMVTLLPWCPTAAVSLAGIALYLDLWLFAIRNAGRL